MCHLFFYSCSIVVGSLLVICSYQVPMQCPNYGPNWPDLVRIRTFLGKLVRKWSEFYFFIFYFFFALYIFFFSFFVIIFYLYFHNNGGVRWVIWGDCGGVAIFPCVYFSKFSYLFIYSPWAEILAHFIQKNLFFLET